MHSSRATAIATVPGRITNECEWLVEKKSSRQHKRNPKKSIKNEVKKAAAAYINNWWLRVVAYTRCAIHVQSIINNLCHYLRVWRSQSLFVYPNGSMPRRHFRGLNSAHRLTPLGPSTPWRCCSPIKDKCEIW